MDDEPTAVCDAQIYSSVHCWSSISFTFRIAKYLARRGKSVSNIPLHHHANMLFVMLQSDALDRFGTRLELRFSKRDFEEMSAKAGFDVTTLIFSDNEQFWAFSVKKVK